MQDEVNRLAQKVWDKYRETAPSQRFLIAISGVPGSGKTTLATNFTARLNTHHNPSPALPIAVSIPLDGYHLSRAALSALPDPITAHARRGAAFTFDGPSFLSLVQRLRQPLTPTSPINYAPSFDHAIADPVADDIAVPPTVRILVFEGNYLSLGREPWREAAALMDERWFVEVEERVARGRLVARHLRTGVARDREEAERRVRENDGVNGMEIVAGRMDVDEVVVSRDEEEGGIGG